jgi:PqqD family protein of HPr-rel-A system
MIQASPGPSHLLKSWGDEAVIYDTASGDTHYLKPFTLALYRACHDHPGLGTVKLAATLAARLGVENTPQFHERIEDALASLDKIGLLESA